MNKTPKAMGKFEKLASHSNQLKDNNYEKVRDLRASMSQQKQMNDSD